MDVHRNLKKPIRCPRCRSEHLALREHCPGKVTAYSQDGERNIVKLTEQPDLSAEQYIMAQCDCGFSWRVRGIQRIEQLEYATFSDASQTPPLPSRTADEQQAADRVSQGSSEAF